MGKATIISGGESGRYSVNLDYDEAYVSAAITRLESQIDFYYDQIDGGTLDANGIARRKLWIAALRKKKAIFENTTLCPGDRIVSAWCADLTEDLTGTVGTIEIESASDSVLIRPGYEGNAVFQPLRDGQMQALLATDPAATVFNWMFHDGRQKWFPRHRLAVLVSVDHDTDTCSLALDSAAGVMTGEDINIMTSFSSVPIEYMSCNSPPFEAGDRVVVEFTGNDWASPVVIGFESEPKSCDHDYCIVTVNARPWDTDTPEVFTLEQYSIVWDVGMNAMAGEIPASSTPDDFLTFPCKTDDLAYWASITEERESASSLDWTAFDDLGEDWSDPWLLNPGVPSYPADAEGVMCSPALYDFWELADFNYRLYQQDRFLWESETNEVDQTCSQRTMDIVTRDNDWPFVSGYHLVDMVYEDFNSPLGDFEPFVINFQDGIRTYDPIAPGGEASLTNWTVVYDKWYFSDWWTVTWPSTVPHAVYSKNSNVQIYARTNKTIRGDVTWRDRSTPPYIIWDKENISKLQIHAAASYHPNAEGEGGIDSNPLMLARNNDFEDALLDLLKTQLQEEDGIHGEDWSTWRLDDDLDTTIPGPGDSTLFDSEATETYQIPLLYSLAFDIQFRETPEEEE